MSADRLYRIAGPTVFVTALVSLLAALWADISYAGGSPSHALDSGYALTGGIGMVAGMFLILAFTGVYLRQADGSGQLGFWGFVLTWISGAIFLVALFAMVAAVFPLLNADDRKALDFTSGGPKGGFAVLIIAGSLCFIVGPILYGWASVRAGVYPSWMGWTLLAAGVLTAVATGIRIANPSASAILLDVPTFIFYIGLAGQGYWLGMRDTATARATRPAVT